MAGKWWANNAKADSYYNDYVAKASRIPGYTVLSKDEMFAKYNPDAGIYNKDIENTRINYNKDIVKAAKDLYNKTAAEYSKATGKSFEPYKSTWSQDPDAILGALGDITAQAGYVKDNKEPEAPAYKFEMPTEWQTVEDFANAKLKEKAPEFNPDLVTEWEGKLDPLYARQKEDTTKNAQNVWGMMFGQEGGSTYEASKLTKAINDIDLDKLNKALAFAEVESGRKYSEWKEGQMDALNKLSGIAQFKGAAGQFKSSLDASNYWNKVSSDWNRTSADNAEKFQMARDEQQAELAKELARIATEGGGSNGWEDLAKSIISGGATGLTYKLLTPKA